ncbi:hypothetical protein [Burkholderia ambifaria]|uniref:hypothetical protein n=1 Tax=Burkholderia ambifaria TaxID=152480 RepID=UPI00158BAA63|nr:hypothetical protein [Burkholderia ambifaria]
MNLKKFASLMCLFALFVQAVPARAEDLLDVNLNLGVGTYLYEGDMQLTVDQIAALSVSF